MGTSPATFAPLIYLWKQMYRTRNIHAQINGCISHAPEKSFWSKSVPALVSPHPGQGIPKKITVGHAAPKTISDRRIYKYTTSAATQPFLISVHIRFQIRAILFIIPILLYLLHQAACLIKNLF